MERNTDLGKGLILGKLLRLVSGLSVDTSVVASGK